ncbi:MAG: translation initiation factor IF-2 [Phycisphaerales bacterium JB043]
MAKRVFEIARDLGVKSKAILEKCQAEGIPNMNNHMSSVSAGLEATIHDWFSQGENTSSTETAAAVDLEKAKAKPKKKAKAKAKKKPVTVPEETGEDIPGVAVTTLDPAPVEVTPPATLEDLPPVEVAARASDTDETQEPPQEEAPESQEPPKAEPNIPKKPTIVKPAGPQLEVQTPAKLSGPKVVRIEAPDPERAPRQRAPRMGGHGGVHQGGGRGAGPIAPPDPARPDTGRGGRNKRRSGATDTKRPQQGGKRGLEPASRDWKPGAWREQDLVEREARLSRAGGYLRQRRREMKRKQQTTGERAQTAAQTGGKVKISAPFTIKDLSSATGVKSSEIIKKLFLQGVVASVNSGIESEKAMEIMFEYDIELDIEERKSAEEVVEQQFAEREVVDERSRPPVVTILGHVDHGKTSLLDRIRNANVAEGEAGGITQATSAFRVPVSVGDKDRTIVFFDTPGHEAFTAMRARGANITDIVVLVVAADDGVMPQTVESISHAKAAGVPIIIALNKIDKPEATESNIQKIYGELAEHELNPVDWGGETEIVKTSAIENTGITDLLEVLDYQAELLELRADHGGPARGSVIESQVVQGRGSVASILVQDGTLKVGDFIVCGRAFGRVRDITNDRGERVDEAGPAMPVQISGIDTIPDAGDKFYIVDSLKKAEDAAEQRREHERETELSQPKVTLESMLGQLKAGDTQELRVLIKADVQGSLDVLKKSAEDIHNDEVRVRVLHAAVGGITESDVLLADASKAVIIGFNVIPSGKARKEAEKQNIEIRSYDVIYDIIDDLKKAAEGLLTPELRQEVIGHAEVREVFKISKVGAVAGCYVTDGTIERNAFIRVTRDDIVIENDRLLEQLKRFKDDAKEVRAGQECGMKIVGYDDIKQGDVLECYRRVEVKRTL